MVKVKQVRCKNLYIKWTGTYRNVCSTVVEHLNHFFTTSRIHTVLWSMPFKYFLIITLRHNLEFGISLKDTEVQIAALPIGRQPALPSEPQPSHSEMLDVVYDNMLPYH